MNDDFAFSFCTLRYLWVLRASPMQHGSEHCNDANGACDGLLETIGPQCGCSSQLYYAGLGKWEALLGMFGRFAEHGTSHGSQDSLMHPKSLNSSRSTCVGKATQIPMNSERQLFRGGVPGLCPLLHWGRCSWQEALPAPSLCMRPGAANSWCPMQRLHWRFAFVL